MTTFDAYRTAARCPDCDSTVTLDQTANRVSVKHDNHCPTLAALEHQGRTHQIAIVRKPGQSDQEFADDVLTITEALARERETLWPGSAGLRMSLGHGYTDLDYRPKVGRNDPCPCGSGRKYKRCCIDGEGGT